MAAQDQIIQGKIEGALLQKDVIDNLRQDVTDHEQFDQRIGLELTNCQYFGELTCCSFLS